MEGLTPPSPFSSASRKLACPSACSKIGAVLFTQPSGQALRRSYFPPQTFRTQGLATLSASLSPISLEASFSFPHSRAFPFKAFLLFGGHRDLSIPALHSCTLEQNLPALLPCFSGLLPPKKPVSFSLPEGLVRVGAFLLSWAFQPLGCLPPMNRSERHLPFQIPLSLFESNLFAEIRPRNLRVLRPHRLGYLSS